MKVVPMTPFVLKGVFSEHTSYNYKSKVKRAFLDVLDERLINIRNHLESVIETNDKLRHNLVFRRSFGHVFSSTSSITIFEDLIEFIGFNDLPFKGPKDRNFELKRLFTQVGADFSDEPYYQRAKQKFGVSELDFCDFLLGLRRAFLQS